VAAPVYVSSGAGEVGEGKSASVKAVGAEPGYLILVQATVIAASATFTSAMTKIAQESEATEGITAGWFWVIAGSKEPTVTVEWSASGLYVLAYTVYKEVNASAPINAFAAKHGTGGTEMQWASCTTTVANTAAVLFGAKEGSGGTPASGYTERLDALGAYLMTGENAAAGATGEKKSTAWTASGGYITCQIALAPKAEGKSVELKGAVSSSSTLSGKLTRSRLLKAVLSSSSTLTGKLETTHTGKTVQLAGAVSSPSTMAGRLTRTRTLHGALSSASSLVGALKRTQLLHGGISSASALTGSLTTSHESGVNRLRVVEKPPMRQYVVATSPNGAVNRWGEDEPEAANVLEELTDSDTAPGGHKALTGALPRKPGVDYSDMSMGTKLEVFGAGQYKVSEYRLERTPRSSGDFLVMDPAASGYQVLLTDDEGARAIPLDADLNSWEDPSAARQAQEIFKSYKLNKNGSAQVDAAGSFGEGSPAALAHSWSRMSVQVGSLDLIESWYGGDPIELGRVLVEFIPQKNVGPSDTNWNNVIGCAADNLGTGAVVLNDFNSTSNIAQYEIPAGMFSLFLQDLYNVPFEGEGQWEVLWRQIKVQDRAALKLYGSLPEVGILASDFITYALGKWAPGIRFTTGAYGSLKASTFPIPHLVFKEPTTVQEMITQALKFELLEWGVWPGQFGPTFYLNERGKREGAQQWRARIRPAKLTETGQQMEESWNRVVMSWQDPDGTTRTMGPVGSGYPYTDYRCEELDPENPLNEAGVIRTKHLTMEGVGTAEGAANQARLFLEKCRLLNTSGEATLTGYVEDVHGIEWPYYCVHAGDTIEFLDASIKGPRYIIEATRSRKSRSVNIKLDSPPDSYESILAELQVRETAAGVGS
jgi:hypothetical protein